MAMELCTLNTPWYMNRLFCPRSCSCLFVDVVLSSHRYSLYQSYPKNCIPPLRVELLKYAIFHHSGTALGALEHGFGAVHQPFVSS